MTQSPAFRLRGVDFIMYLVDDMARARTFYESLFALLPGDVASEYFVEYALPDGGTLALAKDPRVAKEPSGGAMFGVDDATAAIARVQELGGQLLRPYGGESCTSGWCLDPEGNTFGVHQRKTPA
jgi:predicted enzyme related to lactoylglutathione lyase